MQNKYFLQNKTFDLFFYLYLLINKSQIQLNIYEDDKKSKLYVLTARQIV